MSAGKRLIKRTLQMPMGAAAPLLLRRHSRQLLVLTYHRILPADDARARLEQPGMMVTPETFAAHLRWIKAYLNPVHLTDWLDGKATTSKRPCCAITFDDGWRDNAEFALPLLRQHGLPATLFLVSDFIGTARAFWPGRVQRLTQWTGFPGSDGQEDWDWLWSHLPEAPEGEALSASLANRLIERLKQYRDDDIETRLDRIEAALGMHERDVEPVMLSWEEVNAMISDETFELGSHTRTHRRLNHVSDASALDTEIVGARDAIRAATGRRPRLFCYPNGDRSARAEELVRGNYDGACLVQRGWNTRRPDPHRLLRVGLHEDVSATKTAFLARIQGVF
ncbi:polysaccharide deacetylase family protein [Aquisalimonas lutea]|uniref:polysaccharide deacetylase family protein n=1 Tax=Aquisalimonas lutea TaxID=1327750 RepID=UPI0025B2D03B|nr:polysaccharide deacetylase family protein [Aquisalimonas lutea]MDN3517184.1 polysaccharide deacetylase family protein [Aquisalimonas lutea]